MADHQDTALAARPIIHGAVWIAATLLSPSPTNPRKAFAEAGIEELATSLRTHGQISPILARPNPAFTGSNGRTPWEIVAGERRWRAAQRAGMAELMTIVRDMTDFEVLEVQIVENLQRTDLHPLEEAAGYAALLRQPGDEQGYANADDLAARLGKSRSYVYQRLKLCDLQDAGRQALLAGSISTSVALLIARMPAADQAEATKAVAAGFGGEPFTYRSASDYLQKQFMLRLDRARFNTAMAYEVAGPCGQCAKRSGAAPSLFEDLAGADMCQDRKCFEAKTEESHQAKLQAAREAGHKVVSGDEARALMPVPHGQPVGYQWLDKPCPAFTDSKKPLRQLLGLNFAHIVVVDHPVTEEAIELAPDDQVKAVLAAKGLLREQPAPKPTPPAPPAADQTPATALAQALTQAQEAAQSPAELLRQARALRRNQLLGQMLFKQLHAQLAQGDLPLLGLRLALGVLLDDCSAEGTQLIYDAHGWDTPDSFDTDLRRRISKADSRLLGQLLIEAVVCEDLSNGAPLDVLKSTPPGRLAEHYKLDLRALLADATEAAAEQIDAEERQATGGEVNHD